MSTATNKKKAVIPAVEDVNPYAVGQDFLKLYQRSFDTAFDKGVEMMALAQNTVEEIWAEVKKMQDDGIGMLEEFMKGAKKTQNEYWQGLEASFRTFQPLD